MKPVDLGMLIIVFIMFIVLIVGLSVGTERYKKSQILTIQDSMEILADNQRIQFQQFVDRKVDLLKGMAKFPEVYGMDKKEQKQYFKDRSKAFGFHHIFIMGEDGTGYYIEEGVCRDQKDEPFFKSVMSQDLLITEPFHGGDATIITICVSIYNEEGHKVGALCGAVELKEMEEMFRENQMFLDGKSYLMNRGGNYIAAEDMDKVYRKLSIYNEDNSETSIIKKAFEEKRNQKGTLIQDGILYQANVTYLKDFDWAIVQCIERETIFKDLKYIDVWRNASYIIVIIIVFCVIRITMYWNQSNKKINTDTLTGCSSRAAMENLLEHLNDVTQHDISVIYLDLNKFKEVNDTYGHDQGDRVLCMFSNALVNVFGKEGYVGRVGGDEFMVVLLDKTEETIIKLCKRVDEQLKEKSKELELEHILSTSYGFATRKRKEKISLQEVVNQADERMYQYKEQSR